MRETSKTITVTEPTDFEIEERLWKALDECHSRYTTTPDPRDQDQRSPGKKLPQFVRDVGYFAEEAGFERVDGPNPGSISYRRGAEFLTIPAVGSEWDFDIIEMIDRKSDVERLADKAQAFADLRYEVQDANSLLWEMEEEGNSDSDIYIRKNECWDSIKAAALAAGFDVDVDGDWDHQTMVHTDTDATLYPATGERGSRFALHYPHSLEEWIGDHLEPGLTKMIDRARRVVDAEKATAELRSERDGEIRDAFHDGQSLLDIIEACRMAGSKDPAGEVVNAINKALPQPGDLDILDKFTIGKKSAISTVEDSEPLQNMIRDLMMRWQY